MASDTKKDLNGYDNQAFNGANDIGIKRTSKTEGNLNGKHHFVEEQPVYVKPSSPNKLNSFRCKIVIILLVILFVVGIVVSGVMIYLFAGGNSSNRPDDMTTSKMTTPTEEVSVITPGVIDLGLIITLVDLNYTDDLADESTEAYKNFTNVLVSAVDSTYENDQYYGGVSVISLSPGSIKVELMMSFNIPVEETQRSNAIETILDNLIQNMESAMNMTSSTSVVEVITPLCNIEPCINGGACSETQNPPDYSCHCRTGFTGKSCQIQDTTGTLRLHHGEQEEITSPGYYFPGWYSSYTDMTWYIIAPPGYGVAIDFPRFDLENGFDFLFIYDGITGVVRDRALIHALTGNVAIGRIKTFGSNVWLRFTSDESVELLGFRILLSTTESMDCGDEGVFDCLNGRCIFSNATCDGFNDCRDFSDEDFCPPCEDVPQSCMNIVPYNSTYFPNPNAENSVVAQEKFEALNQLSNCHNDMMELACSTFFPECIHYGPTRRPCFSDCIDVTDACQDIYQQMFGQPWPIDCTFLTDSQKESDGSCSGPEGDYLHTTICGTRPAYTPDNSRIVGGIEAKEGEFPWMVYLYSHEYDQVCGGTLIGSEWVVTAAHCVVDDSFTVDRIVLGDLLLSSQSDHHLSITPAEIIPYPYYETTIEHDGDFALIKLSQPVTFNDFVRPACLAESSDETKDYTRCFISGWGETKAHFDADVLRKAIVHLIPNERCAELYVNQTTDLMICAGYEQGGIDSCQGDSGGPLVCEGSDGRWHLVGATSWGRGCAEPGYPGIYARVSQFLDFINEVSTE